jgi:hypothetical protein
MQSSYNATTLVKDLIQIPKEILYNLERIIDLVITTTMIKFYIRHQGSVIECLVELEEGIPIMYELKKQIASRKNPLDRCEWWEMRGPDGEFDDYLDEDIIRSRLKPDERKLYGYEI